MYSPALTSQLAEVRVDELHRVAHTYNRGRDANRPSTVPPSVLRRALSRIFASRPAVNDEAAAVRGIEAVGHTSPATPRLRS